MLSLGHCANLRFPKRGIPFFSILALGALAPSAAHATVLAQYNFTSNSALSSDTEMLTTAGSYTNGSFTGGTGAPLIANDRYEISTNTTGTNAGDNDVLSEALANGTYATFTLNPNGNTLRFDSLTFTQSLTNGLGTITSVSVFSSLVGFAEANVLATYTIPATDGDAAALSRDVTLSGFSELQSATVTSEWRLYFYDNSDTGSRYQNIDSVVLNGSVVPEPASALMLLGGLGMFAMFRQRR